MLAGSPNHGNVVLLESVDCATDVVDLAHHEIQVIEDALCSLTDSNPMMEGVRERTHECDDLSDTVGLAKVQDIAQEYSGFFGLRRAENDMSEALYFGVTGHKLRGDIVLVRNVELECCLCARFHDPSCRTDVARVAFARGQPFERSSSIFQPAVKIFEFVLALKHPAYGFKTPTVLPVEND